jgi:cell division protein FtsB
MIPDPPPSSRLIALGTPDASEAAAIAVLDQQLDPDWLIFHSRKPLRERLDIDVLIVTPHVVFIAELKNYRDTILVTNGASWQRRRADGALETLPNMLQGQAQRQAQQLKTEFRTKAGLHHLWIEPVVIFTHAASVLEHGSSDHAQLAQLVFCLPEAKAKLEALVAQSAAVRRQISRQDVTAIAQVLDQAAAVPATLVWPVASVLPRSADRQAERDERQRKRQTRQLMSILALVGALLVTIGIYTLVSRLSAQADIAVPPGSSANADR